MEILEKLWVLSFVAIFITTIITYLSSYYEAVGSIGSDYSIVEELIIILTLIVVSAAWPIALILLIYTNKKNAKTRRI